MGFRVGDTVVHWSYGLGKIIGLEERAVTGEATLYYIVQIGEFTVYVPVDDETMSRLRPPTSADEFKKLFTILSGTGEALSEDRLERRKQLRKELADGKAEAVCRVIRDLSSFARIKPLNDEDKNILQRASNTLCSEWGFSLSVPLAQAELDLHHLLAQSSENVAI